MFHTLSKEDIASLIPSIGDRHRFKKFVRQIQKNEQEEIIVSTIRTQYMRDVVSYLKRLHS